MTKRAVTDWAKIERIQANTLDAELRATVPEQWRAKLDILALHDPREPVYRRSIAWAERLTAFREKYGSALAWSLDDGEICRRAEEIAGTVSELLTLSGAAGLGQLSEPERLDVVRAACDAVAVPYPVAITAAGAIARGESAVWWRRTLRRKVARVVEHGAIVLGVVNRHGGAYASDGAVSRRAAQLSRNAAMLGRALMRNEAGQVYTLADLAALSPANPDIRRGELMTRIRGCEEYADAAGHPGVFLTLTTPSRFHAVLSGGKGRNAKPRTNPKYQGATPRDAQTWLRTMWARVRSAWARKGIKAYGFRVAEPHHDATPHWHSMLWFESGAAMSAAVDLLAHHWLSDDGDEPGALKNRINVKPLAAGRAAGYVAKYVAKNVGGSVNVDGHTDGDAGPVETGNVQGVARVDAWAATWGIRQFQAIGQPSVTVWRELRRVTSDQAQAARIGGDAEAWQAWGAVRREGSLMADWCRYMGAMGGACRKRHEYRIVPACRINEAVNGYGETVTQKKVVGVQVRRSGRWLVSRRIAWGRVAAEVAESATQRASMARTWSGFNNCTARLTGELRRALLSIKGGGGVDGSDYLGA